MKNGKTVALIGATGLVGSHLLDVLLEDSEITTLKVLVRRPFPMQHSKLQEVVLDFADHKQFKSAVKGCTTIFCAVGTTNKKVNGNQEAYKKVDYDITVNAARFGAHQDCKQFAFVSSTGADSSSRNFYLQLKGDIEEAVKSQKITTTLVFRPSFLLGKRDEFRLGERLGILLMKPLKFLMPATLKPIEAATVANAMHLASKQSNEGCFVYHYDEMQRVKHGNRKRKTI